MRPDVNSAAQTELKEWYQRLGFIEGETREFEHLPFSVTFMSYEIAEGCHPVDTEHSQSAHRVEKI